MYVSNVCIYRCIDCRYVHERKIRSWLRDVSRFQARIAASNMMLQLTVFITHEFNAILFIEFLSFVFPTFVVAIKYYYFYLNTELVSFLDQVLRNLTVSQDEFYSRMGSTW